MSVWRYSTSFVNRLFGGTKAPEITLSASGVTIGDSRFSFAHGGHWTATSYWLWKRVVLTRSGERCCDFIIGGAGAAAFLQQVALCRIRFQSRGALDSVEALRPQLAEMLAGQRFVPHHEVAAFADVARPLLAAIPPVIWPMLESEPGSDWKSFAEQLRDPAKHVSKANDEFTFNELSRLKSWFDRIAGPPTRTQREIAIRDETNSLVAAGAGTGKTSTILTKVAYLVHAGLAAPDDILVVAFNRDAAQEIRDRCRTQGIEGLTVETFHALGLRILGEVEEAKPAILSLLETDQGRDELVASLLADLRADEEFADDYARFVLLYGRPNFAASEALTKDQYVRQTRANLTKTLSGEWVRSTEELRIANWLFAHGIRYTYESRYGLEVPTKNKRQYRPDFTITFTVESPDGTETEQTVYLEHQALDQRGNPPSWMQGYAEKVRWVRSTHQAARTTLVESFSWWFRKGDWEDRLAAALKSVGVPVEKADWSSVLQSVEGSSSALIDWEVKSVQGLFRRAIDLVRATATDGNEDEETFLRATLGYNPQSETHPGRDIGRTALFDKLFIPLFRSYQAFKRAHRTIDFEDMIFRARKSAERGDFRARWSHYIVDEFQDASCSRLGLINALRAQRSGSRLLCVGDDWQSIIRFAGSDIRVMTQFEQRVGPFQRSDLDLTFRSSSNISSLARDFVLRNPNQLKKNLQPAATRRELPVRILFHSPVSATNPDGDPPVFRDVLSEELARIADEFDRASVLVLSRYRRGVPGPEEQNSIRGKFPTLTITWSTAHASKGREADAVIVGDLDDSPFGFPCLREDDPLIIRLLPPEDSFPCGEERRLFYVAMTRAKERLVLVANSQQPSAFVLELLELRPDLKGLEVVRGDGAPWKTCPSCGVGTIVARDGVNGRFYSCTKSPVCTYNEEVCPSCRIGFLLEREGGFACSNQSCSHRAALCPRCRKGWLQTKTNRESGNSFLGCSRYRDEEVQCTYTQNLGTGGKGQFGHKR